jgi:hypothetical protein
VGRRKAQRDRRMSQQFGADNGMPVQGKVIRGCLGEFGSCGGVAALGIAVLAILVCGVLRYPVRAIALVDLDLAIVADLDEGFAPILQAGLVILPRRKARFLIQHVHRPALPCQFIPALCDGSVLQGPERVDVGEIADVPNRSVMMSPL